MSRPIDEKIVKMKLDNSDFQRNADKTVGIFGRLSKAFTNVKNLNLKKSVDGLSQVQNGANRVDMTRLASGVENVSSKFNALGAVAFTVLQRMTNKAIDAGLRIGRSLTIQPVKDGLAEYETKINAIQTIMSNTQGKSSMSDITASLSDLNTYADKTIYNFAEMTRNIGTFTAAGVGLEDSQTAIKGIANLAAASGSNSQQASTAMYQLSQALATGSVKLQDWNSVVNAGMGGKLFQNALDETAKKLGKGRDESVSFRESLQDGWITTEVLMETLKDFSADQSMIDAATKVKTFTQLIDTTNEAIGSGWANTWELIVGDFEEAREMWSSAAAAIAIPIQRSADARNALISDFVELGGKATIIQTVKNVFEGLLRMFALAKGAWKKVFPPVTAYTILKIARGIRDFTANLDLNRETAIKVSKIFEGLFSVFRIGVEIAKLVGNAFLALIPEGTGTAILDLVVRVAELIIGFKDALVEGQKVEGQFDGIRKTVAKVVEKFKDFRTFIEEIFKGTTNVLEAVWSAIRPVVEAISGAIGDVTSKFTYDDIINGGLIAAIIVAVKKLSGIGDGIGEIFDTVKDAITGVGDSFSVFDDLTDALSAMTGAVKADSLMKIAVAVGVMAASIKLLSGIDAQDISKSVFAIATIMMMLNTALKALGRVDFGKSTLLATVTLPALAGAVLAMAVGLRILAGLDINEMAVGLAGLVTIVTALSTAMIAISKFSGPMRSSSFTITALATAVVILSGAVYILGKMDTKNLAKGVISVGVIIAQLAIFMKIANGSKINMGSAVALTIVTGAVHVMVQAIKSIANIPVNDIVKGLGTVTLILAQFVIFTKLTSGAKVMGSAVAMTIVAGAINLLVRPIQELGSTDIETLAIGLGTMAVSLGLVVAAMTLASSGLVGAIAITAVAGALNLMVVPLKAMGSMSITQVATSLVVLAGSITIMAVAANLIGIGGAVALVALAAAIASIGLAAAGVAIALSAFVTALSALASLTLLTVKNIIVVFGELLDGFILLLPKFIELVVVWITGMAEAFAEMAPTLADSAGVAILGVLVALATYIPDFVRVGADLVLGLMQALEDKVQPLIDQGVKLIISLLEGMSQAVLENEEQLVSAVMDTIGAIMVLVVEALTQLVEVIFGWIPGVEGKAREMGDAAKDGLYESFNLDEAGQDRIDEFGRGVGSRESDANVWGEGLAGSLKDGADSVEMTSTGSDKGSEFVDGVKSKRGAGRGGGKDLAENTKKGAGSVSIMDTGRKAGDGWKNGIIQKYGTSNIAGTNLAKKAKEGASGVSLSSTGAYFADGFASGIAGRVWNVVRSATGMVNSARGAVQSAAAIRSPSRVMMEDGAHFGQGFAIGIDKEGKHVADSARQMAMNAIETVKSYASIFSDELMERMDLNPTITPVMDFKNVSDFDINGGLDIRGIEPAYPNLSNIAPTRERQSQTVVVENNNEETIEMMKTLIDKVKEVSSTPIQVAIDVDGNRITRVLANPMKKAIDAIEVESAIIASGRRGG